MTSSNQKRTSVQNQECQQSTFTGYYRQVVFVVLLQCHPVHKRVKDVVELHRTWRVVLKVTHWRSMCSGTTSTGWRRSTTPGGATSATLPPCWLWTNSLTTWRRRVMTWSLYFMTSTQNWPSLTRLYRYQVNMIAIRSRVRERVDSVIVFSYSDVVWDKRSRPPGYDTICSTSVYSTFTVVRAVMNQVSN